MKTIEEFKKLKHRTSRGLCLDQLAIQTNQPKGTYKRGDKHPFITDLVYRQWDNKEPNRNEVWITVESFNKEKKQRRKRENKKKFKKIKKEQDRKYYLKNKQKVQDNVRNWKSNNKDKTRIHGRTARVKRKALLLNSIDLNTNRDNKVISHIYTYAQRLSNKLNIVFEVDHIIPLSIGGLHHPSNLQVVPRIWNRRKYNRTNARWLPQEL